MEMPFTTFDLVLEEDGVLTLPDEAVLHLGLQPGREAQLMCDVQPDGAIVLFKAP